MSDLLAFEAFPKIDRYTNEAYTITEKIDGTNACVVFDEEGWILTQSRNRVILPGNDNAGFAEWAHRCREGLFNLLGPGRHYGEWWGLGIQRGYGQMRRRFSLFNTHRWSEWQNGGSVELGDVKIDSVPVLSTNTLDRLDDGVTSAWYQLETQGSVAAPGYMNPEGAMIYLHRLGRYLKAPLDAKPKWMAEQEQAEAA
jgi:hypothetical protein